MRQWKAPGNRGAAIARLRRQLVAALVDHLERAQPARPPVAGWLLWQVFAGVSACRSVGPGGPDPIRPTELDAWARLHGVILRPHHVAIILAMDAAWLAWASVPEAERVVGVMTPERFDAMFG